MKIIKYVVLLVLLSMRLDATSQSALSFIERAMEANGPWKDVHSFHYNSRYKSYNPWQSYSFTDPKATNNRAEFHMDFDNKRYRNHSVFNYAGGYVFDFITVGKDSTRYLYDKNLMRNGKMLLKQGKDSYVSNMNIPLQSLPYYQLKILLESNDSLLYSLHGGDATITRYLKNGSTHHHVFDAQTMLLKKSTRLTKGQVTETAFENYKYAKGLAYPSSITQSSNGKITRKEDIKSIKPNLKIPASVFEIPAIYSVPNSISTAALGAKEIAKDVFLVPGVGGDRNVLFINMNDCIVVTEAPVSDAVTASVLNIIHETLPGKPVKYVHLSHHHNDHTAGIRQMVAEGATIVCARAVEAPMWSVINSETTNHDDYSKNSKHPTFETFSGVKVLEDKDHRVEFHEVANSHADGMSLVYLPKEGIIYQGDLLSVPEDNTLTPAIAVSREFDEYLRKNNIRYNRIIGHHGSALITPAMFSTMLKL